MLLERDELTSGSTWHAAGLLPLFNMSYADEPHPRLLGEVLQDAGGGDRPQPRLLVVGNLRMAQTEARMDEYMLYASTAETVGMPLEWLTPPRSRSAGRWCGPRT
jgi:dimethylglycine dehydrogenase